MLDTNTVSYIVKRRSMVARQKLNDLGDNEAACISAVVEGELRYGLIKRPQAGALQRWIEAFIDSMQVLSWGSMEARVYGELRARQEASGKILDHPDLLIAAHALATGAILVTNDKVFAQVRGLRVVSWATDL
jgi:tRNA(fMet)-specific endonuclease VapC